MDNAWIKDRFKEGREFVKIFYGQKSKGSSSPLAGAIAVMEMSPDGFFHVHLLAYGYYWPQEAMTRTWYAITGDSYIVHVSSAEKKGPVNALGELLKYIIKPNSSPMVLDTFYYSQAIKGRRRLHTWGIFYNCQDIRPAEQKGTCPFCGGPLKKVCDGDRVNLDDGDLWPAWAVRLALADHNNNDIPDRYKTS